MTDESNHTQTYTERQVLTITGDHYATSQAVVSAAIEKGIKHSFNVAHGLCVVFADWREIPLTIHKYSLIEVERLLGRLFEFRKQSGRVTSLTDRALRLVCAELRERLEERALCLYQIKKAINNLEADGVCVDWDKDGLAIKGVPTKTEADLSLIKYSDPEDVFGALMGYDL